MQPIRSPSGTARRLGLFLALALAGVTRAQDAPAPAQGQYQVRMTLDVRGQTSAPLLVVREDQPFAVAGSATNGNAGKPWRATFTVHRTATPGTVRVDGRITEGDATLAAPALVGRLGEPMAVKIDDTFAASLVVTERAP